MPESIKDQQQEVPDSLELDTYFTKEQTQELKKLEYEAQRIAMVVAILEGKAKIKQIKGFLDAPQEPEAPRKYKREETDY